MRPFAIEGATLSHPGCVRADNEDTLAYVPSPHAGLHAASDFVAVLADGMGGHAAGEIASQIAVSTMIEQLRDTTLPPPRALARGMDAAHRAILARGEANPEYAGMGTTCTVLYVRNGHLFLAHVGDSRAYLHRDGRLRQLSEDHSAVAELVRDGKLTADQARHSPFRHVILQALGLRRRLRPLIWPEGLPIQANDVLLVCSDGLTDMIDDDAIARTIASTPPQAACDALVGAALRAGAPDNVSVGIFAVRAGQPRGAAA